MDTSFERSSKITVEWYTPVEILEQLGDFDLDPCSCIEAWNYNHSAKQFFAKNDNGIEKGWVGRVWLNPPYSNPEIQMFMRKMAEHNNGMALLYNRADSSWFQNYVLKVADSIMFLHKRIKFIGSDGKIGGNPGAGSVLVAYGKHNTEVLENCNIDGYILKRINKM